LGGWRVLDRKRHVPEQGAITVTWAEKWVGFISLVAQVVCLAHLIHGVDRRKITRWVADAWPTVITVDWQTWQTHHVLLPIERLLYVYAHPRS
jgi:hypothetical protein